MIGGTGLIGSKLVEKLRDAGHEPLPASPDTGVNTLTGEGLDEALAGADVVVDVSNAPAWEDAAVLDFFQTSSRSSSSAGSRSRAPTATRSGWRRCWFSPRRRRRGRGARRHRDELAAERHGRARRAQAVRLDELARRVLSPKGDARQVKADVHARYFGAELDHHSLTPGDDARIAPTRFEHWLSKSTS